MANTYLNPQYMNWTNKKCNSLKPQVVPFLSFIPSLDKSNQSFQTMFTRLWKRDIKSLNWDFLKVNSTIPSYFLDLRKFVISNRICFIIFGLGGGGTILHSPHIKNFPRIAKITWFKHFLSRIEIPWVFIKNMMPLMMTSWGTSSQNSHNEHVFTFRCFCEVFFCFVKLTTPLIIKLKLQFNLHLIFSHAFNYY